MKAIIMAGGEGTRLRPLSSGRPKPMVKLLERPVLEHIVSLLKSHGITEIITALRFMPDEIIDYFGDGSKFGVTMHHSIESEPLGTAGSVKACMKYIGNEDFLVISGDAACDLDLTALMDDHREHNPYVTLALYSHPEPLQYGTVLTSREGGVIRFIEKPSWDKVITDLVNTGIYVVSPRAMNMFPDGVNFDFAKDLFPLILEKEGEIRAIPVDGYWCDIGSPEAFLKCTHDALTGKLRIDPGVQEIDSGLWCASPIPVNAEIIRPCVIGDNVHIGENAIIGPNVVISSGSVICAGAEVDFSVIDGGIIGGNSKVSGAVVCKDSFLADEDELMPGDILAPPGAELPPIPKQAVAVGERESLGVFKELPCASRARLMRSLSEALVEAGADFTDGLSIDTPVGKVRISPSAEKSSLIIEARANKAEFSKELCNEFEMLAKALDDE